MIKGIFSGHNTIRGPAVIAWVIYDVGNTLFFTGIVGILFPLWVTKEMSGDDATIGFTLAAAMGLVLVLAPIVGAFSDQAPRRKPFLVAATFTCVAATLLIGGDNLTLALSLFAVAVVAVGIAVIFYNALLVEVSTEVNRGTVAGLGVGIGYVGAIIAVAIALVFVESRGYVFGFRATGVVILLVSAPVLMLLKEQPRPTSSNSTVFERIKGTFTQLRTTLGNIQQFPGLRQYLIARFWYTWAVPDRSLFRYPVWDRDGRIHRAPGGDSAPDRHPRGDPQRPHLGDCRRPNRSEPGTYRRASRVDFHILGVCRNSLARSPYIPVDWHRSR